VTTGIYRCDHCGYVEQRVELPNELPRGVHPICPRCQSANISRLTGEDAPSAERVEALRRLQAHAQELYDRVDPDEEAFARNFESLGLIIQSLIALLLH
jgi:hypothetical protein